MRLVLFIGIPASGKTTFYVENFLRTHVRISQDMLKTRRRQQALLDACFAADIDVVVDKTLVTRAARAPLLAEARARGVDVDGVYFASRIDDCLRRNALRTDAQRVPDRGVRGHHARLQIPSFEEGFTSLTYVALHDDGFTTAPFAADPTPPEG